MLKFFNSLKAYVVAHKIISVIVVAAVITVTTIAYPKKSNIQLIEAKRGTISQQVEVTGRVTAIKDLSLGFQAAGTVASVKHDVGARVSQGEAIVILDQADLLAQLAQARANAAAEQANLASLLAGTRPEELKIKQTAVEQAAQDLNNSYQDTLPILESAYLTSNDAVRKQVNDLFTQQESISPQLSFTTYDQQAQIDASSKRYAAGLELDAWRKELNLLYAATTTDAQLVSALDSGSAHLSVIRDFLSRTNDALNKALGLSSSIVSTYKADLTTASTQVSTAITNVSNASQAIKTKTLALKSAQNDLALAQAGSTPQAIDSERAKADAANANVANIQAQIEKTVIRAPISGVVTRQDAKVGQTVSPGVSLVGLISEGQYEIDANVPEVDIGKMVVGDAVNVVFDALQDESFTGKVFFIDPAETVIDGAVNFKIKVVLDKPDPRVRSGFTANLEIITQTKENAIILPQFAILQNDQGTFVKRQEGKNLVDYPITVGIRSKEGYVEVLSGVKEGDMVVNIGLKSAGQ